MKHLSYLGQFFSGLSPLMPAQSTAGAKPIPSSVSSSLPQQQANTDKYSALSELESAFSTTSLNGFSNPVSGMGVNWDSSSQAGARAVDWNYTSNVGSAGGATMFTGSTMSGYGSSPPPPSYAQLATAAGN